MHFADGSTISNFQRASLRETYTDPLGELTFETTPPARFIADYLRRLAKGELVTVLVNGVNQGGYLIQTSNRKHGKQGTTFSLTCHTPLITPYQASIEQTLTKKAPTDVPLTETILNSLQRYGFQTIIADTAASVTTVSGKPIDGRAAAVSLPALKHNESHPQQGETAYQYIARLITRLGCCLRMAPDGTLLVGKPDYDQPPVYTLIRSLSGKAGPGDYFVGDVDVHDTNDGQFSECQVRGQSLDTAEQTQSNLPVARVQESLLHASRPSYRSPIAAPYKPKIVKDKGSRDRATAASTAKLELGLQASKAFYVQGMVGGFVSTTGRIWSVDTIAHVVVEREEIDEDMWILERTLTLSRGGGEGDGEHTRLKLLPKGALVLGDVPS